MPELYISYECTQTGHPHQLQGFCTNLLIYHPHLKGTVSSFYDLLSPAAAQSTSPTEGASTSKRPGPWPLVGLQ